MDPTLFWLVEEWKDVDDLKNHLTVEKHVKDIPSLVETLTDLSSLNQLKREKGSLFYGPKEAQKTI